MLRSHQEVTLPLASLRRYYFQEIIWLKSSSRKPDVLILFFYLQIMQIISAKQKCLAIVGEQKKENFSYYSNRNQKLHSWVLKLYKSNWMALSYYYYCYVYSLCIQHEWSFIIFMILYHGSFTTKWRKVLRSFSLLYFYTFICSHKKIFRCVSAVCYKLSIAAFQSGLWLKYASYLKTDLTVKSFLEIFNGYCCVTCTSYNNARENER